MAVARSDAEVTPTPDAAMAERPGRGARADWGWAPGRWRALWRSPAALVGLGLVGLHVLLALAGPVLAPYPATEFHPDDALQAPPGGTGWARISSAAIC